MRQNTRKKKTIHIDTIKSERLTFIVCCTMLYNRTHESDVYEHTQKKSHRQAQPLLNTKTMLRYETATKWSVFVCVRMRRRYSHSAAYQRSTRLVVTERRFMWRAVHVYMQNMERREKKIAQVCVWHSERERIGRTLRQCDRQRTRTIFDNMDGLQCRLRWVRTEQNISLIKFHSIVFATMLRHTYTFTQWLHVCVCVFFRPVRRSSIFFSSAVWVFFSPILSCNTT